MTSLRVNDTKGRINDSFRARIFHSSFSIVCYLFSIYSFAIPSFSYPFSDGLWVLFPSQCRLQGVYTIAQNPPPPPRRTNSWIQHGVGGGRVVRRQLSFFVSSDEIFSFNFLCVSQASCVIKYQWFCKILAKS